MVNVFVFVKPLLSVQTTSIVETPVTVGVPVKVGNANVSQGVVMLVYPRFHAV